MSNENPTSVEPSRLVADLQGSVWAITAAKLTGGKVVVAAGDSHARLAWWDGVSGELLGAVTLDDPAVVRSVAAVPFPNGGVRFAASGSQGTVQVWNGANGEPVGRPFSSGTGPVWSMAALRSVGGAPVLFAGGDDGQVRRWDADKGEQLGDPFGAHDGAVRAMTVGLPAGGKNTLVTGGDDGTVCRWDAETGEQLGPVLRTGGGSVWGLTEVTLPSGISVTAGCSNNGKLYRWDDAGTRLADSGLRGSGALTAVIAVLLPTGRVALITGGTDGQLLCWDAETGAGIGRPEVASERGVVGLCTVPAVDGRDRLAVGGTDGSVTIGPVVWGGGSRTRAAAQIDSTDVSDGLGRRVLAEHVAALLRELAADPTDSAVVHIDGPWGAGKSTLVQLVRRLLGDKQPDEPSQTAPLVVDYDAWRENAIAPAWWSLAAAIEREVRRSRPFGVRVCMQVWSVLARTARSPATLTALAVTVAGGLVSALFWHSWIQVVAAGAAVLGGLVSLGQVIGRTLFWHSAPFGRLHLHAEHNPLGQVADMIGWLRRWSPRAGVNSNGEKRRRPILLLIDDLDRCDAERVVKILETVHTILRHPPGSAHGRKPVPLFVLVLADGRWVRQAYTSCYAGFCYPGTIARDLGSDFALKVFDHVVLVPDLFADQVSTYLGTVTAPPVTAPPATGLAEPAVGTAENARHERNARPSPDADLDSATTLRIREDATAAATAARSDHLLETYAELMPANPRMIKRIANALGMLLALRAHLNHDEDDDALARAAILLVRFPVLAARLRHDECVDDADPCWKLPGVAAVRGEVLVASLARCLGRAQPVAS